VCGSSYSFRQLVLWYMIADHYSQLSCTIKQDVQAIQWKHREVPDDETFGLQQAGSSVTSNNKHSDFITC
jgi:hypothetical protein